MLAFSFYILVMN